jgi:hypothetical protein
VGGWMIGCLCEEESPLLPLMLHLSTSPFSRPPMPLLPPLFPRSLPLLSSPPTCCITLAAMLSAVEASFFASLALLAASLAALAFLGVWKR